MFSREELDIVTRNSRCANNSTDAGSISGITNKVKNRGQDKRVIGSQQGIDNRPNLAGLGVGNGYSTSSSLPRVCKCGYLNRIR